MTSVERINQYATLEQEAAAYTNIRPPNHWPSHGNIQLSHMSLTYKDVDTPALGPISLTIQSCEKVIKIHIKMCEDILGGPFPWVIYPGLCTVKACCKGPPMPS